MADKQNLIGSSCTTIPWVLFEVRNDCIAHGVQRVGHMNKQTNTPTMTNKETNKTKQNKNNRVELLFLLGSIKCCP